MLCQGRTFSFFPPLPNSDRLMTLSSVVAWPTLTVSMGEKAQGMKKKKIGWGYCFCGRRLTTAKRDRRTRPKDLIRTMPLKRSRRSFSCHTSPTPACCLSCLERAPQREK
ncbi:hypothetical protein CEXT_779051 [Caerostris extrusa]|uniref:Secreted protein n=1 Tax=Caerostris extrusa TaxID=172846 RepID=A0AAV4MAT2_CAEEX|nr:hypothetical protein CEXT_779051 [Caerostris extrusa]